MQEREPLTNNCLFIKCAQILIVFSAAGRISEAAPGFLVDLWVVPKLRWQIFKLVDKYWTNCPHYFHFHEASLSQLVSVLLFSFCPTYSAFLSLINKIS